MSAMGLTEREWGMAATYTAVPPTMKGAIKAKWAWIRAGRPECVENCEWVAAFVVSVSGLFK